MARAGLRATTVQDILAEAEVSRRTFYVYFANKDEILQALYADVVHDLVEVVAAGIDSTEEAPDKIHNAVDAYLSFQVQGGALLIAMQTEAIRSDSALRELRCQTLDQMVQVLSDSVTDTMSVTLDPMIFRALLLGIEGLVLHVQADGAFEGESRDRVSRVVKPLVAQVLSGALYLPKAGPPEAGD
jgi:AcrR family transcriptional regulator